MLELGKLEPVPISDTPRSIPSAGPAIGPGFDGVGRGGQDLHPAAQLKSHAMMDLQSHVSYIDQQEGFFPLVFAFTWPGAQQGGYGPG